MRYRKSKLKRKLKAGKANRKKAETTMEQLKLYTRAKEAEAKLSNSVAYDVFSEVAKKAGGQAPLVFSYLDWRLPKRERRRRLQAMYKGPQQEENLDKAAKLLSDKKES